MPYPTDPGPDDRDDAEDEAQTGPLAADEAAMRKAAAGEPLTPDEDLDATDYFLGKRPAPGSTDRFPLDVDFGNIDEPDYRRVTFKALRLEQLEAADEHGARTGADGEPDGVDVYKRDSYIFAAACVRPPLGPILARRRAEAEAQLAENPDARVWVPKNAAELVSDLFKEAPGTVMDVASRVRRRGRGLGGDSSVREVEAGKS